MNKVKDIVTVLLVAACMTLGLNTALAADTSNGTQQTGAQKGAGSTASAADKDQTNQLESRLAEMKQRLTLTDDQVTKIREIMKNAQDQMKTELDSMRDKITALRDKTTNDVKGLLTDE
jgi:Spy/CpxP family protein refolding chaperone